MSMIKSNETVVGPRERLQELFKEIYGIVDQLSEENNELRSRLRNYESVENVSSVNPSVMAVKEKLNTTALTNSTSPQQAKTKAGGRSLLKFTKVAKTKTDHEENYSYLRSYKHHDAVFEVSSCKWSKSLFSTACVDGTARVWYVDGSKGCFTFAGHRGAVNSARFHPSSRVLCTASGDGKIRLWRIPLFRKTMNNFDNSNVNRLKSHRSRRVGDEMMDAGSESDDDDSVNKKVDDEHASESDTPGSIVINKRLQTRLAQMNSDYVVPWTRGDAVSPVDDVVVIDGDDDASSERREVLKHDAASDDESFESDVALNQFDVDSSIDSGASLDEWRQDDDQTRVRSDAIPIGRDSTSKAGMAASSMPRDHSPLTVEAYVDEPCDALPPLREPALLFNEHRAGVVGADWLSFGAAVASADRRGVVCLWDASAAQVIARTKMPTDESVVNERCALDNDVYTPGGGSSVLHVEGGCSQPLFAVSSRTGRAVMWDARSMSQPALSLAAHEGACSSSSLTKLEDNVLVTAGDDRNVRVWDLRHTATARVTAKVGATPHRIAVSCNGLVAVPCEDKRTRVIDVSGHKRAKLRHEDKVGHKSVVTSSCWSSDESVLFTSGWDSSVKAWWAVGSQA